MGAFLHDVGKIDELTYDRDFAYTDEGQLIGHVVMAVGMLEKKLNEAERLSGEAMPEELVLRLKHMIVSHHGQYEYGSPKLPMTLEAVALHHLDNLDAKIHSFDQLMRDDPNVESAWTNFHHGLGRKLYKGEPDRIAAIISQFADRSCWHRRRPDLSDATGGLPTVLRTAGQASMNALTTKERNQSTTARCSSFERSASRCALKKSKTPAAPGQGPGYKPLKPRVHRQAARTDRGRPPRPEAGHQAAGQARASSATGPTTWSARPAAHDGGAAGGGYRVTGVFRRAEAGFGFVRPAGSAAGRRSHATTSTSPPTTRATPPPATPCWCG